MVDICGIRDIDDLIYKELHKMYQKEINEWIKYNGNNKVWKAPSYNLSHAVNRDRGAFQHFYNDIWYNMSPLNQSALVQFTYSSPCMNCQCYGFPCRNCSECFTNSQESVNICEVFHSNFDIREGHDYGLDLLQYDIQYMMDYLEEEADYERMVEYYYNEVEEGYWSGRD